MSVQCDISICSCAYVPRYAYEGQKQKSSIFLHHATPRFLQQSISLAWMPIIQVKLLASEFQRCACLHPLNVWVTNTSTATEVGPLYVYSASSSALHACAQKIYLGSYVPRPTKLTNHHSDTRKSLLSTTVNVHTCTAASISKRE